MLENLSLAFQGIWSHKLRSFLTMLGIIIGIASLITIISTIKGTNEQIKQQLVGNGNNTVLVQLYQNDYTYDLEWSEAPSGVSVITEETREELLKLEGVSKVSLFRQRMNSGAYYKNSAHSGYTYGIDENYFDVYNYQVDYGRGFTAAEMTGIHRVVIVDDKTVSGLFEGENPLGKTIEIQKKPYTVVGVVHQSTTFTPNIQNISDYYTYQGSTSGKIFIPTRMWDDVYRFDEPQTVAVKANSTDEMTVAGKAVADYLTASQIQTSDSDSPITYRSEDLLEQAQQLQELSTSTNSQLVWIAGISLLVGGIGVMNIMLVSVTERTREIGLKKAIGAKKRRILWQFLTEAASLTFLGGVLGVVGGLVMAKLISTILGTPTAISVPAIAVSVVFSVVIGIVFGLLPAVKASNLNPIDALRRE